jgi:hypothetical protein
LTYTSHAFCSGYFGEGFSQIICPSWSQIAILISASQVARISGMIHGHPASRISYVKRSHIIDLSDEEKQEPVKKAINHK